jgi:hypothetical protein
MVWRIPLTITMSTNVHLHIVRSVGITKTRTLHSLHRRLHRVTLTTFAVVHRLSKTVDRIRLLIRWICKSSHMIIEDSIVVNQRCFVEILFFICQFTVSENYQSSTLIIFSIMVLSIRGRHCNFIQITDIIH